MRPIRAPKSATWPVMAILALLLAAGASAGRLPPRPPAAAGRRLAQCSTQCPADQAAAAAECSALDQARQDAIRNKLISSCSSVVLSASKGTCCDMLSALSPAEWQQYLPCMCAGSGGLSAFVSPNEVLGACACTAGKGTQSGSASAPSPAQPLSGSASVILSSVGVANPPPGATSTTATASATATAGSNVSQTPGGAPGGRR